MREKKWPSRTGLDAVKQVRYNFIDSSVDILGSPRATVIAHHRLNVNICIGPVKVLTSLLLVSSKNFV
jgi:hypothetical protein